MGKIWGKKEERLDYYHLERERGGKQGEGKKKGSRGKGKSKQASKFFLDLPKPFQRERVKDSRTGMQWPHQSLVFTGFPCFQLLSFQISPNAFQFCVTVLINC